MKSDNQKLRTARVLHNYQEDLRQYNGLQFVVSRHFPGENLFWIEKRVRSGPEESAYETVSVYYVLNFVIFQAPTLAHIVDTRINNAIFY